MHLLHHNVLKNQKNKLLSKDSLIDALDVFKQTGEQILPVYVGKKYQGALSKDQLLLQMIELLQKEEAVL